MGAFTGSRVQGARLSPTEPYWALLQCPFCIGLLHIRISEWQSCIGLLHSHTSRKIVRNLAPLRLRVQGSGSRFGKKIARNLAPLRLRVQGSGSRLGKKIARNLAPLRLKVQGSGSRFGKELPDISPHCMVQGPVGLSRAQSCSAGLSRAQ